MTQLANGNLLVMVTQLLTSVFASLGLILVGSHCQWKASGRKSLGVTWLLSLSSPLAWIEANLLAELLSGWRKEMEKDLSGSKLLAY